MNEEEDHQGEARMSTESEAEDEARRERQGLGHGRTSSSSEVIICNQRSHDLYFQHRGAPRAIKILSGKS